MFCENLLEWFTNKEHLQPHLQLMTECIYSSHWTAHALNFPFSVSFPLWLRGIPLLDIPIPKAQRCSSSFPHLEVDPEFIAVEVGLLPSLSLRPRVPWGQDRRGVLLVAQVLVLQHVICVLTLHVPSHLGKVDHPRADTTETGLEGVFRDNRVIILSHRKDITLLEWRFFGQG